MKSALLRMALLLTAGLALLAVTQLTPVVLREIDAFRVRRVEVAGARWFTAAAAVQTAGITPTTNLFDDPAPWLERLRANPLVVDVRIGRRLPGTLVLHVREAVPVAFARTPELRPIAADGRVLPADIPLGRMDLPVLSLRTRVSGAARAVDPETLRVLRFLDRAAELEPGLIGWVSEAGVHGSAIRLVLRNAADAEVLIDPEPTAERLRELNMTLGELAGADSAGAAPELSRVRRIDVRFHDQVVVSLHERKS